jgi:hypothetical protein
MTTAPLPLLDRPIAGRRVHSSAELAELLLAEAQVDGVTRMHRLFGSAG